CFEGGIRVPAIAHWPGRIAPGVSDEPLMTMDIMPTLLELAGVAGPDDRPLDGVSMQPVFRGESLGERTLHWQLGRHRAMRRGPWKLLLTPQSPDVPMLFHLADDPAEQHDRAAEHPQRVETMRRELEAWLAEVCG